jgi:hypothetical protein
MHQSNKTSIKYYYSNFVFPDEIISIQKKLKDMSKKINNVTIILDPNIFVNFIREIQYYYMRKLISEEEFLRLKGEMIGMVNMAEEIARTGEFAPGAKFNIYLSSISIEANSFYVKYDNKQLSHFLVYSIEPFSINNAQVCEVQKRLMESLKKYSTLITQSNEILQIKYFNQQREFIENIENIPLNLSL